MFNEQFNLENNVVKAKRGMTFYNLILENYKDKVKDVAICKLNGKYHELSDLIEEEGTVEIIYFNTELGIKIYVRTLQFIFIKVALDLFPNSKITIEHSISKTLYGEIHKEEPLTEKEIEKIKEKMKEIINKDVPIKSIRTSRKHAIEIFTKYKMEDKIKLLKYSDIDDVHLYELEGRYDYFYGVMAYSTGIIKAFDLQRYESGFILRRPKEQDLNVLTEFKEQKSLTKIFLETERWLNILGIGEVGTLNEKVINNELQDIVMVSEALHEKR